MCLWEQLLVWWWIIFVELLSCSELRFTSLSVYLWSVYMPIRHPTIGHCRGVPSSMAIPPRTLKHRARLDLTFSHIDDQLRHATPHQSSAGQTFSVRHLPFEIWLDTAGICYLHVVDDFGADNRLLSGT